ncbi:MAG: DNA-processing protein DprA [Acidobacteria bacterium]|nr:DNA-processing protein DprA [Acidobacteriota bacterium]MXW37735.1 DNA-protecting protein DprA [Acidobacteriota bacterium]MYI37900.1 DNA-protecting protein DprA [Acidobacteriota bacterium]
MTNRPAPPGEQPQARLEEAALAIALAERPPPRERARCFESGDLEAAVSTFRQRCGALPAARLEAARRWREAATAAGRQLLILGQPGFPPRLAEIAVPPIALEVAGDTDLGAPAVAVVGSRRATPYGIAVAERLAAGLAEAGLVVVSGLARGVDAAAHRATLRAGGRTVAVLGSAHDSLYPPEHRELARACCAAGAVLTEFPPGTRPLPHHFPRRNRIIAGLTLGTLVVEAAERSGSLATARHAVDSGREVFAVPGPIGSETSAGCHALIRLGATLVTGVADILEELGLPSGFAGRGTESGDAGNREPEGTSPRPGPGAEAARLLDTLRKRPAGMDLDTLLGATGLPVPVALAAVSELERRGLVRRFPGGFLRAED